MYGSIGLWDWMQLVVCSYQSEDLSRVRSQIKFICLQSFYLQTKYSFRWFSRQKPWYQYLSFSRSILFVWIAMIKSKARCDICHKHHKQRFGKLLLRCQLVKKKRGELEHHQWNSGQLTQRKNLSGSLWLPSPMVGWQGFYLHSTRVKFHWVDVPIV